MDLGDFFAGGFVGILAGLWIAYIDMWIHQR